VYVALQTGK